MLGTLSRGYDSPTVTTLARQVGCVEALSFDQSRDKDDDNGEVIARILGVRPLVVRRGAWQAMTLPEVPFVASTPAGSDVLFKGAEEHLAGRVLLTGYHGDKIWGTNTENLSEHFVRTDDSGVALTEYRLWVGCIHCPLPFWGGRQIRDVHAISHSPEMRAWNVGPPSYKRPISRRIVEEAGVPRELFGARKNGVSELIFLPGQFLTPASREDYLGWLKEHRREWIRNARIPPLPRVGACLDWGLPSLGRSSQWLLRHTNWPIRGWRRLRRPPLVWLFRQARKPLYHRRYIFPWAIEHAKRRYPRPF